jgi:hypothetical protein
MVKIKALKDIQSSIVFMEKGEVREIELDEYTLKNWTENSLIEEVKETKKKVKPDENQ